MPPFPCLTDSRTFCIRRSYPAPIVVKESTRLSRFSLIIDYLMYLRVPWR
ncbi:hypothetical protein [Pontibacter pamirensis]|nr:hypothetical protein [Pontibacter pamirensis]